MTVSTISSELLILLLSNLVWSYVIISQCVLWWNWIAVFVVSECLPHVMGVENKTFSSNYTHSSWIISFGYALFNVRDPIPIFDAFEILACSQYGGMKAGCRERYFFSWRFGSLGGSLCFRGQNEQSLLPKVPTFSPWKLPAIGDVEKREFNRGLHNGKPAV